MQDTNDLVIIGRLTKDVGSDERDFGYLQSGTCYAKLSIAVNESKKGQDGNWQDYPNYFEVHVYGKTAENLKPYLTKGQQICVSGTLHQDRWQDKQTGNNLSKVVIKSNNIQLLGSKRDNSEQQSQYAQQYQQQQYGYTPQFTPANNGYQNQQSVQQQQFNGIQPHNDGFPEDLNFNNEEIPF